MMSIALNRFAVANDMEDSVKQTFKQQAHLVAEFIFVHHQQLAENLTEKYYQKYPQLLTRYGEKGKQKCLQDALFHFDYLAQALQVNSKALFNDYIAWAKILLAQYGVSQEDLTLNLELMQQVFAETLPIEQAQCTDSYLHSCLAELSLQPTTVASFYDENHPLTPLAKTYQEALLNRQRQQASQLILQAAKDNVPIKEIYLHIFQPCLREIGRLWQLNEISVAHEHYCTASTQLIMSQLYPYLFTTPRNGLRLVATCIEGNLHEVGMRMVADFFEMEGWDTLYLGANTPVESILPMLVEHQANVLAISATLGLQIRKMQELIEKVHQQFGATRPKIIVGGSPFCSDPELWRNINADGCGNDAMEAITVAHQLMELS